MAGESARPASAAVTASDVHTNVGSYVVDALDPPERAEFRAHLEGCSSCQREVTELSEAAAALSLLVEANPPAALRAATLTSISTERPLPPTTRAASPPPPPAEVAPLDDHPSVMPWSLTLGTPTGPVTAEQPTSSKRQFPSWWFVLAAVLAAIVLFFAGWLVGSLGG